MSRFRGSDVHAIDYRRRAFTMIELLMVLGVLGLLIGILLPVLAGARAKGWETRSLSNLRQLGITTALYTDTYDDAYPFAAEGQRLAIAPDEVPGSLIRTFPWMLATSWVTLMHEVAPWPEHYETWLSDRAVRGTPWLTASSGTTGRAWRAPSYEMSTTLIADSRAWQPVGESYTTGVRDRAVFRREMRFPSSKAAFFDMDLAYLPPGTPKTSRGVLAGDGSAAIRADADAAPPAQNRLRDTLPQIYHDTPNGVHGRDW